MNILSDVSGLSDLSYRTDDETISSRPSSFDESPMTALQTLGDLALRSAVQLRENREAFLQEVMAASLDQGEKLKLLKTAAFRLEQMVFEGREQFLKNRHLHGKTVLQMKEFFEKNPEMKADLELLEAETENALLAVMDVHKENYNYENTVDMEAVLKKVEEMSENTERLEKTLQEMHEDHFEWEEAALALEFLAEKNPQLKNMAKDLGKRLRMFKK